MPVEYAHEGRILALSVPADLDVASRAAAALHVQGLVLAYRPRGVRLHMAVGLASDASLSVLARVRRLCEGLGIFLTLTDRPWTVRTPPSRGLHLALSVPEPMEVHRSVKSDDRTDTTRLSHFEA
ncbi:hypothetical protein ACFQ6B_33445 [Streptomyces wedmorensis]|uniref:Uncharacterized protein n=1 Tax=Streptomyces wedmorensis TaxID=43759 RepID=A0ABW6J725_STRWE